MNTAHPAAQREDLAGAPVPHLSFDQFTAFGRRALIRADIPVVITLPEGVHGLGSQGVAERLGNMAVTVFTEPSDKQNSERWTTKEIRLREFFENDQYQNDPGTWNRIVSNIRNSPADVNAILGFDAGKLFDYRRSLNAANLYQERFAAAVSYLSQPGEAPGDHIEAVMRNYEKDLNDLVRRNSRKSRAKLIDELRAQVDSFDAQITSTLQASDPNLRQVSGDLDTSSQEVFSLTATLETGNWQRVQDDHQNAQKLLHRAEWVLSIVSALTIFLSVWMSLVLPRQVVKPLLSLKEAVDHAVSGNYQIEFELQGKGEVVELAKSVRNLITHLTATRQPA